MLPALHQSFLMQIHTEFVKLHQRSVTHQSRHTHKHTHIEALLLTTAAGCMHAAGAWLEQPLCTAVTEPKNLWLQ